MKCEKCGTVTRDLQTVSIELMAAMLNLFEYLRPLQNLLR